MSTSWEYLPARRQPVWPALRESTSRWAVRYGEASVPAAESEPDGEATLSQRSPACAADAERAKMVTAATRQANARLPAGTPHIRSGSSAGEGPANGLGRH